MYHLHKWLFYLAYILFGLLLAIVITLINQRKWNVLIRLVLIGVSAFVLLVFINKVHYCYNNRMALNEINELIQEVETCEKIQVAIRTWEEDPKDPYVLNVVKTEYTFDGREFKNKIIALLTEIHFTVWHKMENIKTPNRIAIILFSDESARAVNIWGDSYLYSDDLSVYVRNVNLFTAITKIVQESQAK